jgi:hypothetical protein
MVDELIRDLTDEEKRAVSEAIQGRIRHLERIAAEHRFTILATAAEETIADLSNAWALLDHAGVL